MQFETGFQSISSRITTPSQYQESGALDQHTNWKVRYHYICSSERINQVVQVPGHPPRGNRVQTLIFLRVIIIISMSIIYTLFCY